MSEVTQIHAVLDEIQPKTAGGPFSAALCDEIREMLTGASGGEVREDLGISREDFDDATAILCTIQYLDPRNPDHYAESLTWLMLGMSIQRRLAQNDHTEGVSGATR